jgi:hypothetical protein
VIKFHWPALALPPVLVSTQQSLQKHWPAFGFFILLTYQWHNINLGETIPAYGDALEVIWGLNWFAEHFPHPGWTVYPLAFYPLGWQITTFAFSPTFFILLLPLVWMGGAAFAYNMAALLGGVIGFTGMYRLCYSVVKERGSAFAAAAVWTFWPLYWTRLSGQLNLYLAFALLPWLAWALYRLDTNHQQKRWPILIGLIWGLLILISLYGMWLSVIIIGLWFIIRWWQGQKSGRDFLTQGIIIGLIALLIGLPNLALYLYGSRQAHLVPFSIEHAAYWGGSLNNLIIPYPSQQWLTPLRTWLYNGPGTEAAATFIGFLPGILGLVGLILNRRQPRYKPFSALFLAGAILSLGYLLRWNGEFVHLPALEPLNRWLWNLGYALKPDSFFSAEPPEQFLHGLPLPGYFPAIFIPFWENARALTRFISIAAIGLFPLIALVLTRIPRLWRFILGLYLISATLQPLSPGMPTDFPPHPVYLWLNGPSAPPGPVIDIAAQIPQRLTLEINPQVFWGTLIHGRPTVSGTSSSWPAHTRFLYTWLANNPYDRHNPLFAQLIRDYGARLILFHQYGPEEQEMLLALQNDERFHLLDCFDPPETSSPWPYPICVLELTETTNPAFNMLTPQDSGWFDLESWGVWADGTLAWGTYTALEEQDHRLTVEIIPHCVSDEPQSIIIRVGETDLAQHQWTNCDPWQTDIVIPAELVQVGLNQVMFEAEHAWRPNEVSKGANADARLLGFAAARLQITPIPSP